MRQLHSREHVAVRPWMSANVGLPPLVRCAKPRPPSVLEVYSHRSRTKGVCLRLPRRRLPGGPDGAAICAFGALHEVAMSALLLDYLPLVIFIAVALVIGLALLVAPFIVAYQQPDPEKLSAYECGFNAFDDARMKFDVRFYLVVDPVHHLRSRSGVPVPLGGGVPGRSARSASGR